jgi:nucleoside-diphosphate-sugar epimerase
MQVLLAGASGAIGTPLIRALVANGHTVLGLSRSPSNRERLRSLGAEPVIAEVLDRDALLAALDGVRADAVIHELTALKKIPMQHRDMYQTDLLREQGTANLLAAARAVGARRFVTQSFFGGYGFYDHGDTLLTEDLPFAPQGHGEFERHLGAMRSAESQTFAAAASGIEGIVLRYAGFYGPGAGTEEMVGMLRRRSFPVPRGGGGTVSWVYIEDAAAATVAALERGRPGQAYNVADDEPVNWKTFAGALATAFHAPQPFELPRWVFRSMPFAYAVLMATLRISNAKAKSELGWTPSAPTYREGIQRTVQALRAAA